ncbi:low-density lipoprotein receptor-related protein 3-like isoform X2 [Panonychus citri]|uniref:low-density lipoprotein receptor-related protein 3-like isoform X2 n=1 Tax=Panonychus citri TaxID=50023 RepID=UPI0023075B74|nr:low-density lipoprotein receptor-related protein 3-like isoform X2 [Panonychus citri]
MLINLSIWKWILLSIGIVQASHQPSSSPSNHHHHESTTHILKAFTSSPGPLSTLKDLPIIVSNSQLTLPSSSSSPSKSTSESPLSFKSLTKRKHKTSNGSILISSYKSNLTHHNSPRYPIDSGKILSLLEKNHYFVQNQSCDNIQLSGARGSFFNPGYPESYSNETSCLWTLTAKPHEIITISFDDLDIPDVNGYSCNPFVSSIDSGESCCSTGAVIIQSISNKSIPERRFCGKSEDNEAIFETYITQGESIQISFKGVNGNKKGGRGFHATYSKTWIGKPCLQESETKCDNGKCIDKSWNCNRRDECGDGSDETNCDHVCRESNEAQCLNEGSHTFSCYSFPKDRCDGNWNCANGTDERECDKCPHGMFVCSSGLICYSERARCNGNWDCVDFKDELNCGLCGPNEISCGFDNMKQCFNPFTQRCNGIYDCPNGIDEMGCEKPQCAKKILCANNAKCFFLDERCNGVNDCTDGSDERNCTKELCRPEHGSFLCSNGQCIHSISICDTVIDCDDGSDEINCTNELCRPEQGYFLCANGNCIQTILTCDRSNDCGDSSDEINCLKNSVITAALMGSLICGLLLVIAISCTCKLIALRQIEQQRQAQDDSSCGTSINNIYSSSHIYQSPDSEYFYREPPPSYASAVSGIDEYGAPCSSSSSSSRRRPRRLRPRNRRRPPTPPPCQQSPSESDGVISNSNNSNALDSGTNNLQTSGNCSTTSTATIPSTVFPITSMTTASNQGLIMDPEMTVNTSSTTITLQQQVNCNHISDIEEPNCTTSSHHPLLSRYQLQGGAVGNDQQSNKNDDDDGSSLSTDVGQTGADDSTESIQEPYHQHNCSTSSTVTIELNNILPSSQSSSQLDCDQQPLLSG